MKLLHTADWHLGRNLDNHNRLDEQGDALAELVAWADEHQPDAVIIAGDLFDKYAASPEAEALFYQTLLALSGHGTRPVIAIAGNHDHPTRLENIAPLARASGILLVTRWLSEPQSFVLPNGIRSTHTAHGFIEIAFPKHEYPLRIIATPFVNTARLGKRLPEGDDLNRTLIAHWQELAEQFFDWKGVNVLTTHFTLLGSKGEEPQSSDSERFVRIGGSQSLSTQHLPEHLNYVALGHLHRPQSVSGGPCPVVYSGSLLRYSLSESGQTKQAVLAEVHPGQPTQLTYLTHSAGRDIVRQTFDNELEALEWLEANQDVFVAELVLKVDSVLTTDTQNRLRAAHSRILAIKPVLRNARQNVPQNLPDEEQLNALTAEELFVLYYKHENQEAEPSGDLLALFRQVSSREG